MQINRHCRIGYIHAKPGMVDDAYYTGPNFKYRHYGETHRHNGEWRYLYVPIKPLGESKDFGQFQKLKAV